MREWWCEECHDSTYIVDPNNPVTLFAICYLLFAVCCLLRQADSRTHDLRALCTRVECLAAQCKKSTATKFYFSANCTADFDCTKVSYAARVSCYARGKRCPVLTPRTVLSTVSVGCDVRWEVSGLCAYVHPHSRASTDMTMRLRASP
eukprot:3375935-Rhodomonas_salina.8